jgi:small redox-active disulfide protein 2
MREVKVLGSGCANCRTTAALVEEVAQQQGIAINLEKVEALPEIARYGVMATPGVVVDGKVVHAGGVPRREKIAGWLTADATAKPAGSCGCRCSCGQVPQGS